MSMSNLGRQFLLLVCFFCSSGQAFGASGDPYIGRYVGDLTRTSCRGGVCELGGAFQRISIDSIVSGNGRLYRYRNNFNGRVTTMVPSGRLLVGSITQRIPNTICVERDIISIDLRKKSRNQFRLSIEVQCRDGSGGSTLLEGNLKAR